MNTALNLSWHCCVSVVMTGYRILYFRGGILEATDEVASLDVIAAARAASSKHPHFTAEIWLDGKKVAVVRPTWRHDFAPRKEVVGEAPKLFQS